MRRATVVILGVLGPSVTPAHSQETVTLTIEYASAVLTPGQSQTIKVWALMEPGIGQPAVWNTLGGTGQVFTVALFNAAGFNFASANNGQSGVFTNLTLNPFLVWPPATSPGTPDGNGNVNGIVGAQFWNTGSGANPILIWSAVWTPANYDPRVVEFNTVQTILPLVWLDPGLHPVQDEWTPVSIPNSFQVVPVPSAMTALALGAIFAVRRRRRK